MGLLSQKRSTEVNYNQVIVITVLGSYLETNRKFQTAAHLRPINKKNIIILSTIGLFDQNLPSNVRKIVQKLSHT